MESPFVFEKVAQLSSVDFSSATLTCMPLQAEVAFGGSPKWMFHSQKWLFHAHKWLFHALSTLCPRSSFSETAVRRPLRQHAHVRALSRPSSHADQPHITHKASGCRAMTAVIGKGRSTILKQTFVRTLKWSSISLEWSRVPRPFQTWARTPRVCKNVACLPEKLSELLAKTFKRQPQPTEAH